MSVPGSKNSTTLSACMAVAHFTTSAGSSVIGKPAVCGGMPSTTNGRKRLSNPSSDAAALSKPMLRVTPVPTAEKNAYSSGGISFPLLLCPVYSVGAMYGFVAASCSCSSMVSLLLAADPCAAAIMLAKSLTISSLAHTTCGTLADFQTIPSGDP
ncbi:hypothetical protein D3C81_1436550 [compost metagenome]